MKKQFYLSFSPEEKTAIYLRTIITDLADKHGGPKFMPHLTILPSIIGTENNVIKKTHKFADSLKPFKAEFGEISFSTTHFQNVFVRVKAAPYLLDANIKAKNLFGLPNDFYMPHISLIYGDQTMTERKEIADRLKPLKSEFLVNRLQLVPYEDNPSKWKPAVDILL